MDIAGAPGIALGERRSGRFAGADDCPGQGQHASHALPAQQRYTEALAQLEALSTELSEEGHVRDLLVQAREAIERAWAIAQEQRQELQSTATARPVLDEGRQPFRSRLAAIEEKIAAQAWPQALALIEGAEMEFPDELELQHLRQCLANCETKQAEEIIREDLRKEPEDRKEYQDEWRAAQAFFGGSQFREAEQILIRLAAPDRPDVEALLETVRAARDASEEKQFYKRSRATALKLIQENLFEQASDLLCNLLTLFPGDPILERDLRCAQENLEDRHDSTLAEPQERRQPEPCEFQPEPLCQKPPVQLVVQLVETRFRAAPPAHAHWAMIAAAALFLLVATSAALWKFSRNEFPALSQTLATLMQASFGPVNPRPPPRSIAAPGPMDPGNFQALRLLSGPPPVIPPLARLLGIHGNVILEATVDRHGRVTSATFQGGQPLLIQAATDAVLKRRFQPASLNGQPLEVKIRIYVIFEEAEDVSDGMSSEEKSAWLVNP